MIKLSYTSNCHESLLARMPNVLCLEVSEVDVELQEAVHINNVTFLCEF